jgi:hypothetical protein
MKLITAAPIILVVLGIFMLFAGSAVAAAEEGAANSIGNLIQNKWLAIGFIAAGALWFASEEGYLARMA